MGLQNLCTPPTHVDRTTLRYICLKFAAHALVLNTVFVSTLVSMLGVQHLCLYYAASSIFLNKCSDDIVIYFATLNISIFITF